MVIVKTTAATRITTKNEMSITDCANCVFGAVFTSQEIRREEKSENEETKQLFLLVFPKSFSKVC